MKKLLFLSVVFAVAFQLQAQEEQQVLLLNQMILTPHPEKVVEFKQNLAEHNQKFHGEGRYDVSVYEIMTGNDSGKFVWIMTPGSWEAMEAAPSSAEKQAHWDSKVLPTLTSAPIGAVWRMQPDMSNFKQDLDHKYISLRYFSINMGREHYNNFKTEITKYAELVDKHYPERTVGYYSNVYGNENFDFIWADFKESLGNRDYGDRNFAKLFEELHGEKISDGDKVMDQVIADFKLELWKFNPELSTKSSKIIVAQNQ